VEKVFDWHKWDAETYEKPEDILRAFDELGVCGKRIADIRIIGFVSHRAQFAARQVQYEAGVPYEVLDDGDFAYAEQTLVPCTLEANEPIIFTFTDGSTFEVQPRFKDSLRLSVNQVAHDIVDGTNYANSNVNEIFHDLIGSSICSLKVKTFIVEDVAGPLFTKSSSQFRRYQFLTESRDHIGFSITQRGGAWYSVELLNQYHFTYEGNEISKVLLSVFMRALAPARQILIVEGHEGSSYFWINPVKILDIPVKYDFERVDEYAVEEISLEENNVFEFLYYFLEKYFDSQMQVTGIEENKMREFEWNLEHNIYTYATVRKIIEEIRLTANMLRNDFDNPALAELKARFHLYTLTENDSIDNVSGKNDRNRDEIIRDNIGLVLDFYERFCRRMELMMEHAPQYSLISFMGP
jgi:hypothetical protein